MKIYDNEKHLINPDTPNIIKCSSLIERVNNDFLSEELCLASRELPESLLTAATNKDKNLYFHQAILVTSTINKNQDCFTPEVIYAARNSPIHKPSNLEHDPDKIVGHTLKTWVIDDNNEVIDEKEDLVELPKKMHILVGSVIYKPANNFSDEYNNAVAQLIDDIEGGKKYISMECLYKDFDYLLYNDSEKKSIARNESTSYLTKYLLCYGGDGTYSYNGKNYKIGKVVKDINFCAFGYVAKPANQESVIFTKNDIVEFCTAKKLEKIEFSEKDGVVNNSKEILMENNIMSDEVKNLESTVKAQLDEITSLKAEIAKFNVASYEKSLADKDQVIAKLSESVKAQEDLVLAKSTEVDTLKASYETVVKAQEELTATHAEVTAKLVEIEKQNKITARVTSLVEKGLSKEDAVTAVSKFDNFNDEQFEFVAATITKTVEKSAEIKKSEEDALEAAKITSEEVETAADEGKDEVFESIVKNLKASLIGENK